MKPQSAKAKGRNAQKLVVAELLARAADLTTNDIRSTSMGASGVDVLLSEAALEVYPFAIEVKCQENLNIWSALDQAQENALTHYPLLCFKRNNTDMYVALAFDDFLELTGHDVVETKT